MKATELRIGNWVKWNYEERSDGNAYPVEFGYELDDIKNNPNIVKPIPLTEEWLVKFGFEKMDAFGWVKDFITLDESVAHYSFDMWRGTYSIEKCDMTEIPQEIKHVHQLQNLYFALTGQELQTDENENSIDRPKFK